LNLSEENKMTDNRKNTNNVAQSKFFIDSKTNEITWQVVKANKKDFRSEHNYSGRLKNRPVEPNNENNPRCPHCGLSFMELLDSRRVGCANCYTAFGDKMESLLKTLQGNTKHTGNKPQVDSNTTKIIKGKLIYKINIKQELKKAIETENYEQAARIRDQIHETETRATGRLAPAKRPGEAGSAPAAENTNGSKKERR